MSADSIRATLAECESLPEGRAKAQRIESLAAQTKEGPDRNLEATVLLALSRAYEYGGEHERLPIVLGRLLQLLDRFPGEVGTHSMTILWELKWMTAAMIRNPAVPLPTCYRWLDELGSRYRQRGYSPRPVHTLRWMLAQELGDDAMASAEMEASIAAPRDQMADCGACERNDWGTWRAAIGDDTGALDYWSPVLDGTQQCMEEPHRVLAKALLPLLHTGRTDDARGAFLRGYPLVSHNVNLRICVGQHLEFCALTGNEARGLEILAEHGAWLDDAQTEAYQRLSFIGGVCVLLRRLTALGHGSLPAGRATVDVMLPALEQEIRELCGRFDARNHNTAVSDRVSARLAREPLLARLALGFPARLPRPRGPAPAPAPDAPDRPGTPAATVDELIAEALRLSEQRHPQAAAAWEKVAAAGADLRGDCAAHAARSKAGALLRTDPRAACSALLEAAGQFAGLGDPGRALEARARAAVAQALAGDQATSSADAALAAAEAEAAFADGQVAQRLYLAIRLAKPEIAMIGLGTGGQPAPAALAAAAELTESELTLAQRLTDPHAMATCQRMLAQLSFWRSDRDQGVAHLNAARTLYIDAGEPWLAAAPEAVLAELAYQGGEPAAAEDLARAALDHADALAEPEMTAQVSSVLAEAIGAQPGRESGYIDALLAAAARWEGISEPDSLHHTFNAARVYGRLGRHGEAAALFGEVMPRVHIPYQPDVIAVTREQYATSLRSLGRHREAAEQFLEAARLLQDDPAQAAAQARLARAIADELQTSDQIPEAVAAYQRAAELQGGLGDVVERVRSLRSAAWLQFWDQPAASGSTDAEQDGVTAMRAVLSELQAAAASGPSEELAAEVANTQRQLDEMLSGPESLEAQDDEVE